MPTLNWIGKDAVVNHHHQVPFRTLEKKYTFGDADSDNMIIHGDNLEALKALLPQYEGHIKCIYIDPPYNTGATPEHGGWIYNDNVDSPKIQKWLHDIFHEKGVTLEDLTRHDKWLCMMYPRLKLLQRLLTDDGAIFISIDDNEQANLKLICDEIFGEGNFIAEFIWYVDDGHTDNQDDITVLHEYILCYAKNKKTVHINEVVDPTIDKSSKILNTYAENSITKNGEKNPPSIVVLKKGFPCEISTLNVNKDDCASDIIEESKIIGYITRDMSKKYKVSYPVKLDDMIVQNGRLMNDCRVFSGWMNNDKLKKFIANDFKPLDDNGKLYFYLSKNGVVYYRRDNRTPHYIQTVLEKMGTTETNKYMLESMNLTFSYPKPYTLIQFLLSIFSDKDSTILDSFAGSGTTAHAVLNLNKQDNGNRKFILVEMEDYAENITAERVRRVINGYGKDKNAVEGTGGGFSFYELGKTVFNADGYLNEAVGVEKIREYIWYSETHVPYNSASLQYLLGNHNGTAYYFYYEPNRITTLNHDTLNIVREKAETYVIYADQCMIDNEWLTANHIIFKKIPRDINKF